MKKVALLTLGCRVNQSESNIIEGTLKQNGITIVSLSDNPDYCIINTCTVTSKSDYSSRQLIRRAARAGSKVIVTGCYSHLRPDEVREIEGVSEVIDNGNKSRIVDIVAGRQTALYYGNHSRSRPYLKVQDGCNFSCSYCAVPFARGRSVSVAEDVVIERAQLIEDRGFNEIVLTGIHLGTYGHDLDKRSNLGRLTKKLLRETNRVRIRLSSVEINEIDDELLELMQDDRLCRHLHIPMQSGSDAILGLMRRNYSCALYSDRLRTIASVIDNIAIGTDIIVGFPGEREADFSDTLQLANNLPFAYIHAFPYSARPGTPASHLINSLSLDVVSKRMELMLELNRRKRNDFMNAQVNRTLDIILEETDYEDIAVGTSGNYLKIGVDPKDYIKGSIVAVRVNEIINKMPRGIIINPS